MHLLGSTGMRFLGKMWDKWVRQSTLPHFLVSVSQHWAAVTPPDSKPGPGAGRPERRCRAEVFRAGWTSTWRRLKEFLEFLTFLRAAVRGPAGARWLLRRGIWPRGPWLGEGSWRIRILGVAGGTRLCCAFVVQSPGCFHFQWNMDTPKHAFSCPAEQSQPQAWFAALLASKPGPETG